MGVVTLFKGSSRHQLHITLDLYREHIELKLDFNIKIKSSCRKFKHSIHDPARISILFKEHRKRYDQTIEKVA